MTGPGTVLVADHTGLLEPMVAALRPVVCVSGEADAVRVAARIKPSLAVVHGDIPPEGGVALAGRLAPLGFPVVLALVTCDAPVVSAALRVGVRILVDLLPTGALGTRRLERAFEAADRDEVLLAPRVLSAVRALMDLDAAARDPFPALSAREREVLGLMTRETDTRRLASGLGIAQTTVRHHVAQIVAKTGAGDARGAARLARAAGICQAG